MLNSSDLQYAAAASVAANQGITLSNIGDNLLASGPRRTAQVQVIDEPVKMTTYAIPTNGPREVARRHRQIQAGQLAFWHKTPKGKPKIVIRRDGKMVTLQKDVN